MKNLTKKQNEFLNLSILITSYKNWYITNQDGRQNKTFAIKERESENLICIFGTYENVRSFIHGYNYCKDTTKKN